MNKEKITAVAEAGFREIADRAVTLRDELREAGAPQDLISRVDRLLFTAQVGQSNAATAVSHAG
jgi:hypothetical protein